MNHLADAAQLTVKCFSHCGRGSPLVNVLLAVTQSDGYIVFNVHNVAIVILA